MKKKLWKTLKQFIKNWRDVLLPGMLIVGLIIFIRLIGGLQELEWMAYDSFMRMRPPFTPEPRVVVVGIDEADLYKVGGYPLPESVLVKAIKNLQSYHPRVIGLALSQNSLMIAEDNLLTQALQEMPNLIGMEINSQQKVQLPKKPSVESLSEQAEFTDIIVDRDGKLRRSLLASWTGYKDVKYSFPVRMAQAYLKDEKIELSHGQLTTTNQQPQLTDSISFGKTEFPRFLPNSGGYIHTNVYGYQTLLNFCTSYTPFPILSLTTVLEGKISADWIRDRAIIIGLTAATSKNIFLTATVKNTQAVSVLNKATSANQFIYGMEIYAHTTGQIIRAVLDKRPPIQVWPDFWEYIWIIAWGLLGITFGLLFRSPWKSLFCIGMANLILLGICYQLMNLSWWVPVIPTLLALSGAGLTTTFFDRDSRSKLEQQSLILERTFEAVHNGPLQHLAVILRSVGNESFTTERLHLQLQNLNQELRSIYESMRQEVSAGNHNLYLEGNLILDLQAPLSELLYQVYDHTLSKTFPGQKKFSGFKTILTYVPPDFSPLDDTHFSLAQKHGLCTFLQEALCNVGKHAIQANRLDVICLKKKGWYSLQIIDNGMGITNATQSLKQGTRQAQALAQQLGGKFRRIPNHPKGVICELIWPVSRNWLKRIGF